MIPSVTSSPWRLIPLWTPAVEEDFCEVDHPLLIARCKVIGVICLPFILALGTLSITLPAATVAIPFVPLLVPFIMMFEGRIARRAADVKAVNEYLTMEAPSESASSYIRHHLTAAQLLVRQQGNLNKKDINGNPLLHFISHMDLKVFKLLINHGANVKATNRYGSSCFEEAVENKNPGYLEYILRKGQAKPQDFTPSQQVKFWTLLKCQKAGRLLKCYYFDPNIRDQAGFTPIMRILTPASQSNRLFSLIFPD